MPLKKEICKYTQPQTGYYSFTNLMKQSSGSWKLRPQTSALLPRMKDSCLEDTRNTEDIVPPKTSQKPPPSAMKPRGLRGQFSPLQVQKKENKGKRVRRTDE